MSAMLEKTSAHGTSQQQAPNATRWTDEGEAKKQNSSTVVWPKFNKIKQMGWDIRCSS